MDDFIYADSNRIIENDDIDCSILRGKKLYKSLSIVEAQRANVAILPTLVLGEMNRPALDKVMEKWGLPLTVRMDYSELRSGKPLGGIPIQSREMCEKVSAFLFQKGFIPMFHPFVDRFKNISSIGATLVNGESEVIVEVVGEGFDASDLRLGESNPHQIISLDIEDESVLSNRLISADSYQKFRADRMIQRRRFERYIEYANLKGELLPVITELGNEESQGDSLGLSALPERYKPLPRSLTKELIVQLSNVYYHVLPKVPYSGRYVASHSYLKGRGWRLWDLFGSWYFR